MPTLPSSSIGSPDPFARVSDSERAKLAAVDPPLAPIRWRLPAVLFVTTVASILYTAAHGYTEPDQPVRLVNGVSYAVSLLAILLTHEFAHFAFARYHRVNASLPLFIPLPVITPFGTMGAVILMKDRIKSKNALLDIGASGPLAGMLVAIPVLLYGLAHSEVHPLTHGAAHSQEGNSLIYWLMKYIAVGSIPEGWDVYLNPVAFAGWFGLFVTFLNLLPVGQLDGGHVAYALFGRGHRLISRLVVVVIAILGFAGWQGWFVWVVLIMVIGLDHPPTQDAVTPLDRRRQ